MRAVVRRARGGEIDAVATGVGWSLNGISVTLNLQFLDSECKMGVSSACYKKLQNYRKVVYERFILPPTFSQFPGIFTNFLVTFYVTVKRDQVQTLCRAPAPARVLHSHKIAQQREKRQRTHCICCQQQGTLRPVGPCKRSRYVRQALPIAERVH
jgi:hypothetical protein